MSPNRRLPENKVEPNGVYHILFIWKECVNIQYKDRCLNTFSDNLLNIKYYSNDIIYNLKCNPISF
ncbi:MAG: hypothetical protein A2W17_05890 [Planctomycetes bacterium RBG_16_41_13]|nr:MAG: hypothetical protein A2W17_05890 [Planctomycetes bacterium RBG_16_41_13]